MDRRSHCNERLRSIVLAITQLLLINLKASLLLNFDLIVLPNNLPQAILDGLKTPKTLDKVLDAKYDEYSNFYVQKTH
ncbi:hypothetical protein BN59_01578 [Legionella massiliensis]|uniref:Uncharacterized protein n=1 Tax=Legionella massiliensis TaxID=1034943 RepID=A0A078KS55_9GAMM|nr:hypothetical protein BN59_01578 [Legionella massiliensis]CEE13033.1 hypothetical protein BN1094_01578 [Legionella massiliensis]